MLWAGVTWDEVRGVFAPAPSRRSADLLTPASSCPEPGPSVGAGDTPDTRQSPFSGRGDHWCPLLTSPRSPDVTLIVTRDNYSGTVGLSSVSSPHINCLHSIAWTSFEGESIWGENTNINTKGGGAIVHIYVNANDSPQKINICVNPWCFATLRKLDKLLIRQNKRCLTMANFLLVKPKLEENLF